MEPGYTHQMIIISQDQNATAGCPKVSQIQKSAVQQATSIATRTEKERDVNNLKAIIWQWLTVSNNIEGILVCLRQSACLIHRHNIASSDCDYTPYSGSS